MDSFIPPKDLEMDDECFISRLNPTQKSYVVLKKKALEFEILLDGYFDWTSLTNFIHNTKGPAMFFSGFDIYHYYLNGKEYSKEEWERIIHDNEFKEKLNNIINE